MSEKQAKRLSALDRRDRRQERKSGKRSESESEDLSGDESDDERIIERTRATARYRWDRSAVSFEKRYTFSSLSKREADSRIVLFIGDYRAQLQAQRALWT